MQKENLFQFNKSKLKQELPTIIFLSAVQLFLALNFPGYKSLGSFLYYTIVIASSFMITYIYMLAFSSAHKFKFYLGLEGFNKGPQAELYAKKAKIITRIILLILAITTMLFLWSINYYRASNIYYVFLYSYMILSFLLFYKAAHRDIQKNT